MPRAIGQIDIRKRDAILEAAAEVIAVRGFGASIEEVARRAGVSKQTIYNHFGSKTDLVRSLTERRLSLITAVLDHPAPGLSLEGVLTQYATAILAVIVLPASIQMSRMGIASAADMPDLARTIYDAGARAVNRRLADFLRISAVKELDVPDPMQASEVFSGMVIGRLQLKLLFGLDPELIDPQARAREVARRFVRAYSRSPAT